MQKNLRAKTRKTSKSSTIKKSSPTQKKLKTANQMTTIRLPKEIIEQIEILQKTAHHKTSKTDIIKNAIITFLQDKKNIKTPYECGSDLFGKYGSENSNLSADYKKILKEKLHAKSNH